MKRIFIAACMAMSLAVAGCAAIMGGPPPPPPESPAQAWYGAVGGFNIAAGAAATYAESPTADPVIVELMVSVAEEGRAAVKETQAIAEAYAGCVKFSWEEGCGDANLLATAALLNRITARLREELVKRGEL